VLNLWESELNGFVQSIFVDYQIVRSLLIDTVIGHQFLIFFALNIGQPLRVLRLQLGKVQGIKLIGLVLVQVILCLSFGFQSRNVLW
jgi:hypothetical protein